MKEKLIQELIFLILYAFYTLIFLFYEVLTFILIKHFNFFEINKIQEIFIIIISYNDIS